MSQASERLPVCRQSRCPLFPVVDVVGVLSEHHIGAHHQQFPLCLQARAFVALSAYDDIVQVDFALGQFLFGGIGPLLLELLTDVEVFVQAVEIVHHLVVAFLLGQLEYLVLVPAVPLDGAVSIRLPEFVDTVGKHLVVHQVAVDNAEEVGVVRGVRSSARPSPCGEQEQRDANDKFSHSVGS